MNTADRSKDPTRLAQLACCADDLLPHDAAGPTESLVRTGELLAHPSQADTVHTRLGSKVDTVTEALSGLAVRIRLRPEWHPRTVELAAELGPLAQPNHVHTGCPTMTGAPIEFGTGATPRPAESPPAPPFEVWNPPVTVALLDTGLDPHPWFAGRPWLSEWGLSPEALHPGAPPILDRQAGHGTFVAGVLLRHAPGVTIRHHRTLSSAGLTDDLIVAAALDRVRRIAESRRERLDIVVLTAGCYTPDNQCPPLLRRALDRLGDTIVVASAGNDGADRPFWPAALPDVLAVAATNDRGQLARWSNRGDWVDLAAPGVDVVSSFVRAAVDDFDVAPETVTREYGAATWSGTSFAAPHAAAALARLLRRGCDPVEARERIINSFEG